MQVWMPFTRSIAQDITPLWQKALLASASLPDPFCSGPEWAISYQLSYHQQRPVFGFGEHGATLFLAEESYGEARYLVPLESSWMYTRPLLGEDPLALLFKAVDDLESYYTGRPFPLLFFGGIWPHEPFANNLLLHLGHIFSFYLHDQGRQCAASLEGGVDGFLSRRSHNFRANLKKSLHKAQEVGISYERFVPATEEESKSLFARLCSIEEKSWKGKIQSGLIDPPSHDFYAELLTALSAGKKARVIIAHANDEDIGFILGGLSAQIYRGQQFSYDDRWAAFSIGNLLQYQQILWLCEEGILRYDLGPITGEKMGYKAHWAELIFPLECWILKHKSRTDRLQ